MIVCDNSSWTTPPTSLCTCVGSALRFQMPVIKYGIDPSVEAYESDYDEIIRQVHAAQQLYMKCVVFEEVPYDQFDVDILYRFGSIDGVNNTLAETEMFFSPGTDQMQFARVTFDLAEGWRGSSLDFYTVAWHELLHAIGINDHAPEGSDNLMAPEYAGSRRMLGQWDLMQIFLRYCEPDNFVNELVALHFDVAPDLDDLQAMAAGCDISRRYNITPAVVIGTYGFEDDATHGDLEFRYLTDTNMLGQNSSGDGKTRRQRAIEVAQQAFSSYLDTGNGWDAAVNAQAQKFWNVLSAGGTVKVAEGGPMDFTANVLLRLSTFHGASSAQLKNVTVVQHSAGFNTQNTSSTNFAAVQNLATYRLIDNGNVGGNGTADLSADGLGGTSSGTFSNWARGQSDCSAAWNQALDHFDAKLDFSDTVEYLDIMGIGLGDVSDIDSFCNFF